MMMNIELRLNAPDPGDDPENRFDCDHCAYAPTADEHILLVLKGADVLAKLCTDCACRLINYEINGDSSDAPDANDLMGTGFSISEY